MPSIAFDSVAVTAEQLKVFNMVSSSNRFRYNVIYLQVLFLEMLTASVTVASLFSIQQRLVFRRVVSRNIAYIRALRNVRACENILKHSLICSDTLNNQLGGFCGYVNTYPTPLESIRRDKGCGTSTERVKNNMSLV